MEDKLAQSPDRMDTLDNAETSPEDESTEIGQNRSEKEDPVKKLSHDGDKELASSIDDAKPYEDPTTSSTEETHHSEHDDGGREPEGMLRM